MINLMPSRMQEFQEALTGYQQTHVNLIATGPHGLQPAGLGNDLGPFYFIIKLADIFHLPIASAINLFLVSIIVIGLIAGLIGITLLWRQNRYYWWSVASLLIMALISYKIGDIYSASAAVVMGIVPYVLLMLRHRIITTKNLIGFLLVGLACGLANSIRLQSGSTMAIFALLALIFSSAFKRIDQVKLGLILLVGMIIPGLYFNHLVTARTAYLRDHVPGYTETITAHPLWHTTYIGFGYLNNDLGIKYQDEVGINKVASVDPTVVFLSPAYENILHTATVEVIKGNPLFTILTIFSKLGVIFLLYLPFFANWGLWQAFKKRRGGSAYLPFYLTLAFAALPGIIAIPELRYLTGFAALAVLYGLAVLNEANHA